MRFSAHHARAIRSSSPGRFGRFATLMTAALLIATLAIGCSAQPMTLNQELANAALAGAIGAGSGAVFAAAAHQSYPASIGIGAGGMAGFVLLYEEIKREAAMENTPSPPPFESNPPSSNPPSSNQNP